MSAIKVSSVEAEEGGGLDKRDGNAIEFIESFLETGTLLRHDKKEKIRKAKGLTWCTSAYVHPKR